MIDDPIQDIEQALAGNKPVAFVTVRTARKILKAIKKIWPVAGDGIKVESSADGRKISKEKAEEEKKGNGGSGSLKICVHDPWMGGDSVFYSRTIEWKNGLITTSGDKVLEIYTQDTHTVSAGHMPEGDEQEGGDYGEGEDYGYGYGNSLRSLRSDKPADLAR